MRDLQLTDWEKFEAEFNRQKAQVADRSSEEEYGLIFSQLPSSFQYKVCSEQNRLSAQTHWVRVTFPASESAVKVLWELEGALQTPFVEAYAEGGALLINCGTPQLQDIVLAINGSPLGGGILNVSRYKRNMTGDEIFEFVRGLLRVEEEVATNRRVYGGFTWGWDGSSCLLCCAEHHSSRTGQPCHPS